MAITAADWKFIDDVLTSLSNKAGDAAAKITQPSPATKDATVEYLAQVQNRFAQLESKAISLTRDAVEGSPPYELGKEIGRNLIVGAKRASKMAREVGSDLADTFDKTADRLEEGGLTIAKGFGTGLALAVIFALIWLGRKA